MRHSRGYDPDFLSTRLRVPLPALTAAQQRDIARVPDATSPVLDYIHYSVVLSASRRFPYFTATNIDGRLFKRITRENIFGGDDVWKLDERVREYQWGKELYEAASSDFDRGHLTKREDPQWGRTYETALQAARSTFYFTNCAPQVTELNTRSWLALETYILKEAGTIHRNRISVFTGPVLDPRDPEFVTTVRDVNVRIPTLFWKVVYYSEDGISLKRVGFLMGQGNLLHERGIARRTRGAKGYAPLQPFGEHYLDFKDAETYQVNLSTIEQVTRLSFAHASEPYADPRPSRLILKQVQVAGKRRSNSTRPESDDILYEGLTL